ncbi:MAG: undecaprenyl-diphosphate phosphatase [Marinomonas sp.]|uniref:Undecaprenyl-diphosphatase n=1 Tax=Marinomonas pontica TaxID=264739 RepID=A0ABM8FHS5_9GAMM|nr:undecaprenyl-diphosphate phosphatase [Marinomonas pontica]MCW8355334.1 undecaprenyl-diphosphate phosphatase [Marinomonas pontica]BDX03600.1 undecaprenyl-diphosphatase [Marinomonas pontica]
MDVFHSVILGLVEGATEFLPISSTGHMIVVSQWLGMEQTEGNKAFEVIIQLAAILAVIANYKERFTFKHVRLWSQVFVAFLPVAIVGFLFRHEIKAMFSVPIVATMFIVGGVIFLLTERWLKDKTASVDSLESLTMKQTLWIGFAQIFALIPGTSRAGSTIIGALLVGVSRKVSAEFSFLLALPVMVAASGYDLLSSYKEFAGEQLMPLIIGFVVAFLSAFVVMKLFMVFLEKFTFVAFGWYRIIFGALLLFFA